MDNKQRNRQSRFAPINLDNVQRIKTPEGVSKLMENLWLRHKAGLKRPGNNVFWVDLPPLTEEEKAEIEAEKKAELEAAKGRDDKPEDLYGAWI